MFLPITIVICTYNRAGLLQLAVNSVLAQEFSLEYYELIVVDNGSIDDTREIMESVSAKYDNVRYVFEEEQGLSRARNCGWREARGEYIIYIDDECLLPAGYLEEALQIIQQHKPGIFGGIIKAYYNFNKPHWIKDEYFSDILDRKKGVLPQGEYVYGGNMVIRRAILSQLGGFNVNLGMKGKELAFAEEVELQQRAIENIPSLEIYFDSNLWLYHHVRREKVNLEWMLRNYFSMGLKGLEGFNAIQAFNILPVYNKWVRFLQIVMAILYRFIRIFVRVPILLFWRGHKYPYWQQYMVERIFNNEVIKIGVYYGELLHMFRFLLGKETYGPD